MGAHAVVEEHVFCEGLVEELPRVTGGGPRIDAGDRELRHRTDGAELPGGLAVADVGMVPILLQSKAVRFEIGVYPSTLEQGQSRGNCSDRLTNPDL